MNIITGTSNRESMMGVTRNEVLILACMVCAILMNGIDGSIVSVALPSIAGYFGTGLSEVAWVTICYIMMMAGLLLPFGRIANSGRVRQVFVTGFMVFTAASFFCGISENFGMLLAFRVVQGAGAAMMASTAPIICVKLMPSRIMGLSLGVMTLASATGYTIGPFIGGIITEVSDWHWIFLVNVPIGILAILFGLKVLPKETRTVAHTDMPGTATLFVAITAMIIAIERSTDPGSRMLCMSMAVVFVISMMAFIIVERRSSDPLLDLSIFRNWRLDAVVLAFGLINLIYLGALYILPFYLDGPMGLGSAASGSILLIPSAIALIMGIPIGRACDRRGKRRFAILAGVFNVVYCVLLTVIRPEMGLLPVIVMSVFMGLLWGTCGASSSGRIVDNVPRSYRGMGSALMSFVNYTGSAMGTAVFAALMTIGSGASGVPLEDLTTSAFMDGMQFSGVCAIALSLVALVCAYIVKERDASPED